MPVYQIEGLDVDFPYKAYDLQLKYMASVIRCLNLGYNGALESPTGTGKTLSLLCASLAWLLNRKKELIQDIPCDNLDNDVYDVRKLDSPKSDSFGSTAKDLPKIYYAARTHTQLSQVVRELNKTIYKNVKITTMASREQMCINPDVSSAQVSTSVKNHLCRAKTKARTCQFYNTFDKDKQFVTRSLEGTKALDIEDLVRAGKANRFCPYYAGREIGSSADLILLPYNYILDARTRRANKVDLKKNIVIFDEGHNLEKICSDSVSVTLYSKDISGAIKELKGTVEMIQSDTEALRKQKDETDDAFGVNEEEEELSKIELKDLIHLISMLQKLEELIDKEMAVNTFTTASSKNKSNLPGVQRHGSFLHELLKKSGICPELREDIVALLDLVATYLTRKTSLGGSFRFNGAAVQNFATFISTAYPVDTTEPELEKKFAKDFADNFSVYISHVDDKFTYSTGGLMTNDFMSAKRGLALNYWCWSPGLGMKMLMERGIKVVIITSGTLSPLSSFIRDMGIDIGVTLENPHVVEKDQIWMGIVQNGPDNSVLESSYRNRSNPEYLKSLGQAIINISRIVPQGILIFFASYAQMQSCLDEWKANHLIERLSQLKDVYVEPKDKREFAKAMEDYERSVDGGRVVNGHRTNGAIFCGVCRGKISEGIDFSDKAGRAVIIAGIPYPPRNDPKVCLKMSYLEEKKIMNGNDWYKLEAVRAVNQAIGRVIRHKNDFGAIILCDARMAQWDQKSTPNWIRETTSVQVFRSKEFGKFLGNLVKFFNTKDMGKPMSKTHVPVTEKDTQFKNPLKSSLACQFTTAAAELRQQREAKERCALFNPRPEVSRQEATDISTSYNQEKSRPQKRPLRTITFRESLFARPPKSNLLDDIDREEEKLQNEPCCSKYLDEKDTTAISDQKINTVQPKRRIVLKPNSSKDRKISPSPSPKKRPEISRSLSQPVRDAKEATQEKRRKNAAEYTKLAEESLTKEEYKTLKKVMTEYNKNRNFQTLMRDIKPLLLPKYKALFTGLKKFMQYDHIPLFNEVVNNEPALITVIDVDIS